MATSKQQLEQQAQRLLDSIPKLDDQARRAIGAGREDLARVTLERKRVHLDEPIKSLGTHEVPVRLHPEVEFRLPVEVVAAS